jgi:hypothetical protein
VTKRMCVFLPALMPSCPIRYPTSSPNTTPRSLHQDTDRGVRGVSGDRDKHDVSIISRCLYMIHPMVSRYVQSHRIDIPIALHSC